MGQQWRQTEMQTREPEQITVSLQGHPGLWKAPRSSIHLVTAENRHLYRESLEASFRLRHHVYVTERGWETFRSPDGREVDVYDTHEAIYLLVIEENDDRLVGCARLLPTARVTPLKEFPGLSGVYDFPRSPSVYHFSRCVVASDRRGGQAINTLITLIRIGVQEFCLSENIEQLTILLPVALLPAYLELGWNPQPLGLPLTWCGVSCVVVMLDVSEVALTQTRAICGITDPLLVRHGITRPIISPAPVFNHLC
ncbi:acyl-homoserine-lactone synthase [Leptospira interrogans]